MNWFKDDRPSAVVASHLGHSRQPEAATGSLDPGIEMEGKMKASAGLVRINAHFKGEIVSEGTIVIAEQGEVEASIQAKVISIAGKVKGNVHATERLEIKEHGVLLGDIHTPVLTIEPGGYFEGECQMPSAQQTQAASKPPQTAEPEVEPAQEASELQL